MFRDFGTVIINISLLVSSRPLGIVLKVITTICINVTLIFSLLLQLSDLSNCQSFQFLSFSLCGPQEKQNPLDDRLFFFLVNQHYVGLLVEIR